jgi:hypothetical protein
VRNRFDYSSLFVPHFFLLYWNFFNVLAILVLDHFLLVRNVVYATLAWVGLGLPLTTYSPVTWEETRFWVADWVRETLAGAGPGWPG